MSLHTRDALFIGGQWTAPHSDAVQEVISAATEEVIARVPQANAEDAAAAARAARIAFDEGPWPRRTPAERVAVLRRMGEIMVRRRDEIEEIIAADTAMTPAITAPFTDQPIDRWFDLCDRVAPQFPYTEAMEPTVQGSQVGQGVIHREPFGVVTAIPASNGPWVQGLFKIAPALAAGCTVIVMPSPMNPMTMFILAEIADEAGLDPGVLNVVSGSPEVGQVLTTHPDIDMVSFTGSDRTGRIIAAQAAPTLKKVVLELGGKSANLVCEDADLDRVAFDVTMNFTIASGQGCALLTRTLVHESVHDALVEKILALLATIKVGDPTDPTVTCGPLISAAQRTHVENLIAAGVAEGATIAAGGKRPEHLPRGFYIEPTLMVDVDNAMSVAQEEFFGPVGVVIKFTDDDHAVALANDSRYGLSGGVWSADVGRAYGIAQRIRTGAVHINGGGPFMSPHGPFGGYKSSGHGREWGKWGLDEYLQYKTITWPIAGG